MASLRGYYTIFCAKKDRNMFCFLVKKSFLPDTAEVQTALHPIGDGRNAMLVNEAYVLFINGFICDDLASVALVVK